jgi:ABC-2 type transport system permease protein
MPFPLSFQRTASVARKEVLHILRDGQTLFFTLFLPVVELLMLGYAIDTKVQHIPTVVLDQARTQESRALLQSFENSGDFEVVALVHSDAEMSQAIVAGNARVGIKIPENYSRRLEGGQTAQVQILVDGTVSSVAAEAINVGHALTLRDSLQRALGGRLHVEARPRVLFNPDMRSPNFFIPGLMVMLCQVMATVLTATTIVREKEKGTLEQLFMTPVRPGELILGKLAPYLVVTCMEFCGIAVLMRVVFQVPIHGQFLTLLGIALPFVLTMLGCGLWISTRVSTREGALQLTTATLMPCLFLSGYVFPLDSLPAPMRPVSYALPTTWLIDASRGVILRSAGWRELWLHAVVLTGMAVFVLIYTSFQIRKTVA